MTTNPYHSSGIDPVQTDVAAISGRESLSALIQAFLAGEITAFEFDERLDPYRDSNDPVIRHVVEAVWYHYDDCHDHLVCLSKSQWDYFQRLLLVLASDCRIETQTERRWSCIQLMAAMALCGFVAVALRSGWGGHLLILSVPFGLISIGLSYWHRRIENNWDPYELIICPFATFADLEKAYRSSTFRKTQYPKKLVDRKIRSPLLSMSGLLPTYALWLIYSPFVLLFQALPERHAQTRIVVT